MSWWLPLGTKEDQRCVACQPDLINLRKVFDTWDHNGDGFLTSDEICKWMNKLDLFLSQEGLINLTKTCDRNLDGRLDFNEFVELYSRLNIDSSSVSSACSVPSSTGIAMKEIIRTDTNVAIYNEESDLRHAFRFFDKNGDGLISASELSSALKQLGLLANSASVSRCHSMIRRVDSDGDGEVSFAEFKHMMTGTSCR